MRKYPCLYVNVWLSLNPAWFWHTPWSLGIELPRWVSFDECVWDFSSFTRVWYWPYLLLCFASFLQYFCLSLLADSDLQHLLMPLHMSCPLAYPPSAQESPLVTAPDKTSPLRVFCLHLKSKNSSLNKGVFPNLCCILVLTAESLQGCSVWVVAQALPQDGKAASAPGRSVNHTGQCRWAQLQKSQALRKQTSPWLGEDHGIWLFLRRRKSLLLNWREAVVTSVLHFPVFN